MPEPAGHAVAVLKRRVEDLTADLEYWKTHAEQLQRELDTGVSAWRDRIMRDATRRYDTGPHTSTWVVATRRIPDAADTGGVWGLLHRRDPVVPPRIVPPKPSGGQRARYLTGEVRDAGPGSHIGVALCGLPLMADELWIKADRLIKSAAGRSGTSDTALCGLCSYLAGTPTLDAAWEAIRQ